ncbi:uncharacterized protein LOC9328408 isoform X2 [Arabidopsis lyrata subsp. lyrata]|uniref:uncharacterized protein LOC9328408 isoform X2 n=1 Tax=Arabidopsis lyrata subsp. lyrata TaxID=81972 RepID=UPI000A29AFDD|nr:uncharacterized protein LOC9328408 isoform X2 [Arabidopsis lyrata subsp. lyrata]|eukprot:XP_020867814.1 uncharacterized protein LOC9328408 isoform X2 [Arabidopsis lyrata subsp. lyrata]
MVTTGIGGALVVVARSRCFCVTANSDLLRSKLDRLHAEAESTRAKANSNRLRLLRLSEAAENLRKQAAVNVQTGKENDARELLLQKKKVMQALDKAKARIELLDTLSSKLNEAISVKETQLIGNISLDLEEDGENSTSGGIHIVSPKPKSTEDGHANDYTHLDSEGSQLIERNSEDYQELLNTDNHVLEDVSTGSILKEVSSYESFLESLDQKLSRIEAELVTVVNVAFLVLNHEDKPKNLKVQQTAEILEEIRRVRERYVLLV